MNDNAHFDEHIDCYKLNHSYSSLSCTLLGPREDQEEYYLPISFAWIHSLQYPDPILVSYSIF